MNKYRLSALSVSGGVLSGLAWSDWCTGLILLISFSPFFIIEDHLYRNRKKYVPNDCFIYLLPGFVIFSIISIGWVRSASMLAAISIILGLSFIMTLCFWLAHLVRLRSGTTAGLTALIAFWLSYEFLSLRINILTPWLNLGNGLAKDVSFIQWYSVTGTGGGTLWILLSGLLVSRIIMNFSSGMSMKKFIILWLIAILIPSAYSLKKYYSETTGTGNAEEVLIIQPDIDPFTEKFNIPFAVQLEKVLAMAEDAVKSNTDWIITPETTVDDPIDLEGIAWNKYVIRVRHFLRQYPNASVLTGMVTTKIYEAGMPPTRSARKADDSGFSRDYFNSALKIDTSRFIEVYHKSKLVPGIEMQFINSPGRLIARLLPVFGGTPWGYGIQREREVFTNSITGTRVAPVICYESVFGEFITRYAVNGANAIFIITNDGWWKGTNGYKQHLWYASLRAIETGLPVARAANTGVSCLINSKGQRTAETGWLSPAVLAGKITPASGITFYVKYGDYLQRIAAIISAIILLMTFVAKPFRKKLGNLR